MMADVMSRGALSATDQQVAPIDKHQTAPMKNQCRRLHDTKINHAGSTTQEQMSQRTLFKGKKVQNFRRNSTVETLRKARDCRILGALITDQNVNPHRRRSKMNFHKARFITKNDKDSLRQLYGFIFGDGKICVYEYRSFGKTNYNRKLTPILNRGTYYYQHGARKNEPYAKERF